MPVIIDGLGEPQNIPDELFEALQKSGRLMPGNPPRIRSQGFSEPLQKGPRSTPMRKQDQGEDLKK